METRRFRVIHRIKALRENENEKRRQEEFNRKIGRWNDYRLKQISA